jgi:hypothetical protein
VSHCEAEHATLQEPMAADERQLALMAALLLPLRACEIVRDGKKPTALTDHIILDSIKWKRKHAEAIAALHAAAPELLRITQSLQARPHTMKVDV